MRAQDAQPSRFVGQADFKLTVEPPRPRQRRVQLIRTVRRRQDGDALVAAESAQLGEQRVERLLALVVAALAASAQRIDFIDENHRTSRFSRLAEQIAYARSAHAHIHLHKI